MRVLLLVTFPHAKFSAFVKDGSISAKMRQILGELKPEATYFTEFAGKRTAMLIIDLKEASQIPALAEPFFLTFEGDVQIHPVMLPEDLAKSGIDDMAKKWG